MSDTRKRQIASKKNRNASPLRSLTPVPVPIPGDERYRRQPFLPQQTPWWQSCVQWFRYYSIQIRWDIERTLARLFHRRWP